MPDQRHDGILRCTSTTARLGYEAWEVHVYDGFASSGDWRLLVAAYQRWFSEETLSPDVPTNTSIP